MPREGEQHAGIPLRNCDWPTGSPEPAQGRKHTLGTSLPEGRDLRRRARAPHLAAGAAPWHRSWMDRALQPLDPDGRATKIGKKGRGEVMTRDSMRMQARPLAATSQSTAPPAQVSQQPSPRIHYLDWLRVLALLGVFLYHAVHPFDTLEWHVKNADQSELITGVLVFFYPWGLGLFFLLAGAGAFFS